VVADHLGTFVLSVEWRLPFQYYSWFDRDNGAERPYLTFGGGIQSEGELEHVATMSFRGIDEIEGCDNLTVSAADIVINKVLFERVVLTSDNQGDSTWKNRIYAFRDGMKLDGTWSSEPDLFGE